MVTNSSLHFAIINYIMNEGFAPAVDTLAQILKTDVPGVEKALYALQDYHGVVLHPHEPKVWVIHPFSLAPTNFLVRSAKGTWWGNCAWCSLGIAALLNEDATITTRLAAYDQQVVIHITNGQVTEKNLYIHFPIPMKKAWENVMYTCSTMLVFESYEQVDAWTKKHNIPKGDVQPIENVWEFSKGWYGNHLNPAWQKWTMQEAKEIFLRFNLRGEIWDLETSGARF